MVRAITERAYYASECYGKFGVFNKAGYQRGGWWPTLEIANQVANLLNEEMIND